MSDVTVITISIALEEANDPVLEPTPAERCANQSRCDLWSECNDPLCFRAGCRNDVFSPRKGEKS